MIAENMNKYLHDGNAKCYIENICQQFLNIVSLIIKVSLINNLYIVNV